MAGILNRDLLQKRVDKAREAAFDELSFAVVKIAKQRAPVRRVESGGPRARYKTAPTSLKAAAFDAAKQYKYRANRQRTALEARSRALTSLYEARVRVRRRGEGNRAIVLGQFTRTKARSVRVAATRGAPRMSIASKRGFKPASGVGGYAGIFGGYEGANKTFMNSLTSRGRYELRRQKNSAVVALDKLGKITTVPANVHQIQLGGRLKASIDVLNQTDTSVVVGTTVPYALYVEFPTSHNAAQPFLLPALKTVKRSVRSVVKKHLLAQGLVVKG